MKMEATPTIKIMTRGLLKPEVQGVETNQLGATDLTNLPVDWA